MLAKVVNRPQNKGSSFERLAVYIVDGKGSAKRLGEYLTDADNGGEKVVDTWATNCFSDSIDLAIEEIICTQAMNTRSKIDKNYHLIFSFPEGEKPTIEQINEIEFEACKALGFEEHQRICAIHDNTENYHVHIAINKIHPRKFIAHTPYQDYKVLDGVCNDIELKYGLQKTNRIGKGRDKDYSHSQGAREFEAKTGKESLQTWLQQTVSISLKETLKRKDITWNVIHEKLATFGVQIKPRANGLIFSYNDTHIKASAVNRGFSKTKLEKQLGSYEEASLDINKIRQKVFYIQQQIKVEKGNGKEKISQEKSMKSTDNYENKEQVINNEADGLSRYDENVAHLDEYINSLEPGRPLKHSQENYFTKKQPSKDTQKNKDLFEVYKTYAQERTDKRTELIENLEKEKKYLIDDAKINSDKEKKLIEDVKSLKERKLKYNRADMNLIYSKVDIEKEFAEKKEEIFQQTQFKTWYEWLQQETARGNEDARFRLQRATPKSSKDYKENEYNFLKKNNIYIRKELISEVTKKGDIIYTFKDGSKGKFTDQCERVKVDIASYDAIEASLRLSIEKYGQLIRVNGTKDFKKRVAEVAVKRSLNVNFDDKELDEVKEQLWKQKIQQEQKKKELKNVRSKNQSHAKEQERDGLDR